MDIKFTILETSALSNNVKTNSVTQEFIQRFSNTSKDQLQSVVNRIVEDYISTLFMSGYSKVQVNKCLVAARIVYERRVQREL